MNKIIKKKGLIKLIQKNKNKKIVLCHGVFDLVHYGHIMHFKKAKELGDILIVSITKDIFIKKGINRPVFNELQRSKYLSEIKIIDYIYVCESRSAADSIKLIKPSYYVKGPDYKHNASDETKKIYLEKKLVEKFKGKIFYTDDQKFSSSNIINQKNLLNLNYKQEEYIKKIKSKFGYKYIQNQIEKFSKTKILIVGELIFDEYCFGNIIGKSGKEPHLVLKENFTELYVGGSGAIARNISSFVKNVQLIAPFGDEAFLKQALKKNFDKNIFKNFLKPKKNFSSIIKKRFIDEISSYKMFGSYLIPERPEKQFSNKLISKIKSKLPTTDMIIVCDYGHDFLEKKSASFISNIKKFKSLNTQINSSNLGYHSLNNYKNFDLVIINESELRQELREERLDVAKLAKLLINQKNIKNLVVTHGKNGVTLFKKNQKFLHCPAFVEHSLDKVGAGDAMLSMVSISLMHNLDPEIVLFLGSIAAAINVKNVGNKVPVNLQELSRIIKFCLE